MPAWCILLHPASVACLSPYMQERVRRFGQYVLGVDDLRGPLNPQPFQSALAD